MKITAILTAGGLGTRMNHPLPKQYHDIGGKTVLEHTISTFASHPMIDKILVVVPQAWMDQVLSAEVEKVVGGASRKVSVYNGICAIKNASNKVLIHDGVRCMVSHQDITDVIQACEKPFDGAALGLPVTNTLKKVENECILHTVDRNHVWSMQTPQVFFFEVIKKAYEQVMKDNIEITDDAQAVEYIGGRVKVIQGSSSNIKITYPEDIGWATWRLGQ
ncbi:MAG: 2-C-methyl-D-erythritol 4-phosphate cytidylyltransferase [Bdellovibrionales bacterium]|nr:2-C-methyl-D-erythritol 4-phosphate cytidylyltransferase [Bdellovibrionales bacterium]